MEVLLLQVGTVSSNWQISDVLTIVSILGTVLTVAILWMIRFEIRQTKFEYSVKKIDSVMDKLDRLTEEIHSIKLWITRKDAYEEAKKN